MSTSITEAMAAAVTENDTDTVAATPEGDTLTAEQKRVRAVALARISIAENTVPARIRAYAAVAVAQEAGVRTRAIAEGSAISEGTVNGYAGSATLLYGGTRLARDGSPTDTRVPGLVTVPKAIGAAILTGAATVTEDGATVALDEDVTVGAMLASDAAISDYFRPLTSYRPEGARKAADLMAAYGALSWDARLSVVAAVRDAGVKGRTNPTALAPILGDAIRTVREAKRSTGNDGRPNDGTTPEDEGTEATAPEAAAPTLADRIAALRGPLTALRDALAEDGTPEAYRHALAALPIEDIMAAAMIAEEVAAE